MTTPSHRAAVARLLVGLRAALDREAAEAGVAQPWRLHQNYVRDIVSLRFGRIDDGVMQYS